VFPKQYSIYSRSKETMSQFGNGFRSIIQKKISSKRKRISEFIIDETLVKVGSELIWLWVAIEPKNKQILSVSISKERNTFVADRFISDLVTIYEKHYICTDGGTWYPHACRLLKLSHHLHSSFE
jgi:putative transposase